jgi:hypothetical protein
MVSGASGRTRTEPQTKAGWSWRARRGLPGERTHRTIADRLSIALDLLADPAYDALVSGVRVRRTPRRPAKTRHR